MTPSRQSNNTPAGCTTYIVGCSSVPSDFYQNMGDSTLQRLWNASLPFHTTSSFQAVISSFSLCSVCPTLGFRIHTTVLLLKNLPSELPIFFVSFSAVHPSYKKEQILKGAIYSNVFVFFLVFICCFAFC